MTLKKCILTIFSIATLSLPMAAQLEFPGQTHPSIHVAPAASTGLEGIYVIFDGNIPGSAATYRPSGSSPANSVKWSWFDERGGGFATPLPSTQTSALSSVSLSNIPGLATSQGRGIIVEYEGRQHCYWLVNYRNVECILDGLSIAPEQDCGRAALLLDGSAAPITFYTVNGVPQTLSREMELKYYTQRYNEESQSYETYLKTVLLDHASGTIRTDAPLCSTDFTLTVDRFLRQWGLDDEIVSPMTDAIAVDAVTTAIESKHNFDNEQRDDKGAMGGSGPVEVSFSATVSDAAIYREWQFTSDPTFDKIDLRIRELEVDHTFSSNGTTYVRFIAANDDNSCEYISETYQVYVGESKLDCPNAFSPGASEGVNDEWKVSYKSIIDFDCHIFNRWGQEMIHLTHPSQSWDGRYRGKLVPSGTYYYVIKATGSDGQQYKLGGDINIINYRDKGTFTNKTPAE